MTISLATTYIKYSSQTKGQFKLADKEIFERQLTGREFVANVSYDNLYWLKKKYQLSLHIRFIVIRPLN